MSDTRPIWQLRVLIQATPEEAAAIEERIGSAICPDPQHDGFCPIPWDIVRSRAPERVAKRCSQDFQRERLRSGHHGDALLEEQ